jgi:transposase-like protein
MYIACNHKKGISSLQLSRDLDITQKTAWFVLHRIREMLLVNNSDLLQGLIEADETYVGGKDSNKTKSKRKLLRETGRSEKTPVFGILERGGTVRAKKMRIADKKTLLPEILSNVDPYSTVITDSFPGYRELSKFLDHIAVSHSGGQYVKGVGNLFHTNSMEGFWSLFKRGIIGIYHQVSEKHIDRYLNEFTYRYTNRKIGQHNIVNGALIQAEGKRLKYKDLTAKTS